MRPIRQPYGSIKDMKGFIFSAQGKIPCDLLLKNGHIVDVFTADIRSSELGISGSRVAGFGEGYRGKTEIDLNGAFIAPGFIDAHLHIESTMMLPSSLSRYLLLNGTSCVVADPHEIANVMGVQGILGMIQDAEGSLVDFFFTAPSCVPATSLETSGARLGPEEMGPLAKEEKIIGLSEVMDFLGVLRGDEEILRKLMAFELRHGHAPTLVGMELMGYMAAGIDSDHETVSYKEGLEKLRAGMFLMIREGSSAQNLRELLPLVSPSTWNRTCLVTDDLYPRDLLQKGHLNYLLREAVDAGLDPITAIRLVTISPAQYLGLRDRGGIFPGAIADLVVLEDLKRFQVKGVIRHGRFYEKEEIEGSLGVRKDGSSLKGPMGLGPLSLEDLRVRIQGKRIRVITMVPGQLITGMEPMGPLAEGPYAVSDTGRDILKLVVAERHHRTGNVGIGFIKGIGLKSGAIASSVAHDSHNIICVGVKDQEILTAIKRIEEIKGGIVVVRGEVVKAELPLPYGGLMSDLDLKELVRRLDLLEGATRGLGCLLPAPFMTISFLALPVIPGYKLTDRGLVDVMKGELIDLFE